MAGRVAPGRIVARRSAPVQSGDGDDYVGDELGRVLALGVADPVELVRRPASLVTVLGHVGPRFLPGLRHRVVRSFEGRDDAPPAAVLAHRDAVRAWGDVRVGRDADDDGHVLRVELLVRVGGQVVPALHAVLLEDVDEARHDLAEPRADLVHTGLHLDAHAARRRYLAYLDGNVQGLDSFLDLAEEGQRLL